MKNDNFLEETITKHEAAAEKARAILSENESIAVKVREGLNILSQKVSEANTRISMCEGNVIGSWVEILAYDVPAEDRVADMETELEALRRFLQRAPEIKQELERQLIECDKRIKNAESDEEQLSKIIAYGDAKIVLNETYSDKIFFKLYQLAVEIEVFEPEIFTDFLSFFTKLQAKNPSKSRVLAIQASDIEDDLAVEQFRRDFLRYEYLRHSMLNKLWTHDGESLIREMRVLSHQISKIRDFNDFFLPQLQEQNKGFKILELR